MPAIMRIIRMLMVVAVVMLAFHITPASGNKPVPSRKPAPAPKPADAPDVRTALEAAADALGMLRQAAFAPGRTPRLDVLNTMEFWASGTPFSDYHAALVFNPPGMRLEVTRSTGTPQHAIEVVSGKYSWNESQIGAGLEAGKGTATPAMDMDKVRLLRLWTMPFGVVKAGLAAGAKAKVSTEGGMTVVSFPFTGPLDGVTAKVTLDAKNLVTKVETQGPADLTGETDFSDYGDHGEIPTNVVFPGHIVRKRDGKVVADLQIKMADTNNPYIVIPVPDSIMKASQ